MVGTSREPNITLDQSDISLAALKVVRRLSEEGFNAYLVGGCVRDLLLNQKPKDFDVATTRPLRRFIDCFVIRESSAGGFRSLTFDLEEKSLRLPPFVVNTTPINPLSQDISYETTFSVLLRKMVCAAISP